VSREVRRVPLDFTWPLDKVWSGYVRPTELSLPTCPDCGGAGWSGGAQWLRSIVATLGMAAGHAAATARGEKYRGDRGTIHPYLAEYPQRPTRRIEVTPTPEQVTAASEAVERIERETGRAAPVVLQRAARGYPDTVGYELVEPTLDLAELYAGLAGTPVERLDQYSNSSAEYTALQVLVRAAGLDPETWLSCTACGGSGEQGTPEQRAASEAWGFTDPPTGEGWQMWETVSEGSPISPVFPDREGLIVWLTRDYRWGAQSHPLTREQAEAFVGAGHSIASFVMVGDRIIDGVAAVHKLRDQS